MGSLPHFPTNGAALRARAPLLSVYCCCFLTSLSSVNTRAKSTLEKHTNTKGQDFHTGPYFIMRTLFALKE